MQIGHTLADVVVGAGSDFGLWLARNEGGQSTVGSHSSVMSFPSPIDGLTYVPARRTGVITDVEQVGKLLDSHVVCVEQALNESGVPHSVQIWEVILVLGISQARRFIFEIDRHTIAALIAVVFIVQWLMDVTNEMNHKP